MTGVFAVAGAFLASSLARVPALQQGLEIDKARLGLVLLCMALGSLVAMPLTSRWVNRYGSGTTVGIAGVVAATAWAVAGTVDRPWQAAARLALAGAGVGTWDAP